MDDDLWTEQARKSWPRFPSSERFLAQAADMIGHRLFGAEWDLTNMAVRIALFRGKPEFIPGPLIPPRSIVHPDGGSPAVPPEEQIARQRREYDDRCALIDKLNSEAVEANKVLGPPWQRAGDVKRAIIAQASEGVLPTFYRSEVDGQALVIPPRFWTMSGAFGAFNDCRIFNASWMRTQDRRHRHPIFVEDAHLRKVDWKKVEWRAEPAPLGEPELAPTSSAKLPRVSASNLRAWVTKQRATGISQEQMVELSRTAFEGHEPPSGNIVKRTDRDLGPRSKGRPSKNRRG